MVAQMVFRIGLCSTAFSFVVGARLPCRRRVLALVLSLTLGFVTKNFGFFCDKTGLSDKNMGENPNQLGFWWS